MLFSAREGDKVGELAKTYFGDTVDASRRKEDGTIDYVAQVKATKEALEEGRNCIAEASFFYNECFCAVDLLKKEEDGYSIYEVKSVLKNIEKDHPDKIIDVAFQRYVLDKLGFRIVHIYVMHPDSNYVLDGELDVKKYFVAECFDDSPVAKETLSSVEDDIQDILAIYASNEEPVPPYAHCRTCDFMTYCLSKVDGPTALHKVNGMTIGKVYPKGIFTIEQLEEANLAKHKKKSKLSQRKTVQMDAMKNGSTLPIIDKPNLQRFLDTISYPLYHIDFETTSQLIPLNQGFRPGEEYPYQYSLHIEYEDGRLEHKEFLGDKLDCTFELAKSLVENIPAGSCCLAYNADVERRFLRYLGNKYPEYQEHLNGLAENCVDLEVPFAKGYYFDPKQGGSNSIKQVLPALCPASAEAYQSLPGVHNGAEAKGAYAELLSKKGTEEYEPMKEGMLAYCKQDTQSMVDVLSVLKQAVK